MGLLDDLLASLPDGKVKDVCVGLHWTSVVVEDEGQRRCGLASTLQGPREHGGEPAAPQARRLERLSGRELAALARSDRPDLASVGVAAINALLPQMPESWVDRKAEDVIAAHGAGKRVALVGHFPFVPSLRPRLGELHILERHPREGDLPEQAAPQVLPRAEVVAITGMAVANHTLEDLLDLCPPGAVVLLLGPSTPLSPVLFDYGVDLLCGSVVTAIGPVIRQVAQGADFHQVRRAGVRLVTVGRPGFGAGPEDPARARGPSGGRGSE